MDRNKSLIENIRKDIEKTGYPTEVQVAEVLSKRGWKTILGPSYRDDLESRSREFDIRAYREYLVSEGDDPVKLSSYLMMECKKSDKPWVFFTTPAAGERDSNSSPGRLLQSPTGLFGNLFLTSIGGHEPAIRNDDWGTFHHYFTMPRWAHNYHEPFKKLDKSDRSIQIHTAVQSVVAATRFYISEFKLSLHWIPVFYPVVVFDGELFEAVVKTKDDIEISSTNHVVLRYHYIPKSSRNERQGFGGRTVLIDVIRASFIEQYSTLIDREGYTLFELLRIAKQEGRLALPELK